MISGYSSTQGEEAHGSVGLYKANPNRNPNPKPSVGWDCTKRAQKQMSSHGQAWSIVVYISLREVRMGEVPGTSCKSTSWRGASCCAEERAREAPAGPWEVVWVASGTGHVTQGERHDEHASAIQQRMM